MENKRVKSKFFLIVLTAIFVCLLAFPKSVQGMSKIQIKVNGKDLVTDVDPVIVQDRTLIPARALFEDLGAVVDWLPVTKEVDIRFNNVKLLLKIDSKLVYVNKTKVSLDVPAKIINSRTMIPLRFVSERFGFDVGWDEEKKLVTINTNNKGFVNDVSIDSKENMDVLSLFAEDYVEYNLKKVKSSDTFYIDFEGTSLSNKLIDKGKVEIDSKFIKSIEYFQYDFDTARVYVETNGKNEISVNESNSKIVLKIGNKSGIRYQVEDMYVNITLENIWLYKDRKDLKKLYSISENNDKNVLSIEFSRDLVNSFEEGVIEVKDSFLKKIEVIDDDKINKTKVVFMLIVELRLLMNQQQIH